MLQRLHVKNYALIQDLIIEPHSGFNIITGETGAGKSILLGALSLILGERADTKVLFNDQEKCIVEGVFKMPSTNSFLKIIFDEEDLDWDENCTIRREITGKGKSRAFVNDTPVSLQVLQQITGQLVDLHQQFDQHQLSDVNFQTNVIDAVANTQELYLDYYNEYLNYKSIKEKIAKINLEIEQNNKEHDYNLYLFQELEQFNLKDGELESLEKSLKQLEHREKIKTEVSLSYNLLNGDDQSILYSLKRIIQSQSSIQDYVENVEDVVTRLNSVYEELKDISNEIEQNVPTDDLEFDLEQVTNRLNEGFRLLKKHSVQDSKELLEVFFELKEKIALSQNSENALADLKSQESSALAKVIEVGKRLGDKRLSVIKDFEHKVIEILHLIGMPNAIFKVEFTQLNQPSIYGLEQIKFLLDVNNIGKLAEITKVASGGELSRLMLTIKTIVAGSIYLPTLIFDEVDTGISGEAAKQVGILLKTLGEQHQIICITHQPQIAAKAQNHYYVYKNKDHNGILSTNIKTLNKEERIVEIAEMIAGKGKSDTAYNHSKELLGF